MTDRAAIIATLRKYSQPIYEWRVQHPETGDYCMNFGDWRGEQAAREWLEEHRARFPDSKHAGYVVARVELRDEFKDAARAAADLLESRPPPAQAGAGVVEALREMVKMMDDGDEHGAGSDWHKDATAALAALSVAPHPAGAELQRGWLRYEKLRKLNPRQYADLHARNLAGEHFDDMVDALPRPSTPMPDAAPTPPQPAAQPAPIKLWVEARECSDCGHAGINDSHATDSCCNTCGWRGRTPHEDKCPGCLEEGTMSIACPKCGGYYSLVADGHVATQPAAQPTDAQTGLAHELWAAAQLAPGEGIADGADRIAAILAAQPTVKESLTVAAQPGEEAWISVHDSLPVMPDENEDEGRPVYTWDGQTVREDDFVPTYEQPAGPAVGGWLRVGDWFANDNAGSVTHWMQRTVPPPPTAARAAQAPATQKERV